MTRSRLTFTLEVRRGCLEGREVDEGREVAEGDRTELGLG